MKAVEQNRSQNNNLDVVFLLLLGVVASFAIPKLNAPMAGLLFAVQLFVLLKNIKIDFKTTRYFWALMGLFTLSLVGMLYTENMPRGVDMIGRQISFLLFPVFYATYRVKNFSILFKTYCIFICVMILVCEVDTIYRFFYKSDTFPLTLDLFLSYRYTGAELTKSIGLHNAYFGMYILFSNVLLLSWMIKTARSRIFLGLFLLVCLQSVFLLQMVAKTAIIMNLIIVGASMVYILIKQKKLKLLFFSGFLLVLIGLFSYSYLKLPLERITERFEELNKGENTERETRVKLWKSALPIIKENLVVGVGTGDVEDQLHAAYKKNELLSKSNIHNQFLDYLMRYGLVGLLVFLSILGYALVHAIKTANYIYFCFTLIIIGCCFTENIFSRQWGITFYACFNYLLYTFAKKQ